MADLRLAVHFQYYDAYPRYNYYYPDVSIQQGMLYAIIAWLECIYNLYITCMSFDSLSFINYKEPQQSMFCIVVFLNLVKINLTISNNAGCYSSCSKLFL